MLRISAALLLLCATAFAAPQYDLLIRNGSIIDGTGRPRVDGDIAIKDGRIAAIGDLKNATATTTIDAANRIVAPGFIDVHTHADDDLYRLPLAENFIRDGVTTIVAGNCGGSVRDVGKYFENLKTRGVAPNVATLYGHNTVLRAVKGDKAGELTLQQMDEARKLVDQAMRDGAAGLSTGLIYTPGQWSGTEEIIELAKVSAKHGGIYASHMRNEGGGIMEAIDEAVRIGRESGCRVEISHFKLPTDYVDKVGGTDATLARVVAAREAGLEVWLDQYPYTASSTSISTLIPDWVLENGGEAARKLLADDQQLRRALDSMKEQYETRRGRKSMAYVVIAGTREHPEYVGKNLEQVARMRKHLQSKEITSPELMVPTTQPAAFEAPSMEDQYRAAIAIYLDGGASCVFHSMNEDQVKNIMRHPLVAIASDSGVREFGSGQPHPRGYGTNSRVLGRYVRELKLITLEEAIRKMTSMPAQSFRFADRGRLQNGFAADLVIFDEKTVTDKATFDAPHAYAEGFDCVIVNGQTVFENGKMTGKLPGVAIFGPGKQ